MTRLSRTFNRKIELWQNVKVADGFGGNLVTQSKVMDVWVNVRDVFNDNYDSAGSSQNKFEKRITVRVKNLDTNVNFFVIGDKGYQINDIRLNYKENQFECFCEATNFEVTRGTPGTVLIIGDKVLTIGGQALTI